MYPLDRRLCVNSGTNTLSEVKNYLPCLFVPESACNVLFRLLAQQISRG